MAVIEPVIMFNEVAVLDGGPNMATAVAATDCLTWQIGCENFQRLLQRYPQVGLGLLRVLARRNRALNDFKPRGYITATRTEISVHDTGALAHLATESPKS